MHKDVKKNWVDLLKILVDHHGISTVLEWTGDICLSRAKFCSLKEEIQLWQEVGNKLHKMSMWARNLK